MSDRGAPYTDRIRTVHHQVDMLSSIFKGPPTKRGISPKLILIDLIFEREITGWILIRMPLEGKYVGKIFMLPLPSGGRLSGSGNMTSETVSLRRSLES
jgi:hypothetical protein